MRQPAHVRPSWSVGHRACPRALGAKRVRVRIREKEGFKHPQVLRAPCYQVPKTFSLHARDTNSPIVERRFLCFCFFFAGGKRNEVPPRTVANSDKENSQHITTADLSSSNPALTSTTTPEPPHKQ